MARRVSSNTARRRRGPRPDARRRWIAASLLTLLVAALGVAVFPRVAHAAPGPWTWVKATATATSSQGGFVTATCPGGYRAVTGGVDYRDVVSSVRISGPTYQVQAFDFGNHAPLTVTAWCARSDQVDVEIDDRTLRTDHDGFDDFGLGLGDFACSGDRTPVSASMTWTTSGADESTVTQSGPEVVGGTNQWFVTAQGRSTSSVLDVKLLCVANSDLPGLTWSGRSAATGQGGALAAACPAGLRLVSGGEHVDSINGVAYVNTPVDSQTWRATGYVPSGDTLSVSVLCVPAGDPVATITSGPGSVINRNTATFTFTATDPSGGTPHDYCFLNTSGLGPCSGSYTATGLTEGRNVFSVEAYTDDGRGWASTEKDYYFWVDLTRPTVTLRPVPLFTLTTTLPLQATGTDDHAVDHYRFGVTARRNSGTDASTAGPVSTSYTDADGTLSLTATPGTSYRVIGKAVDWAANDSAAAGAITAAPLDNLDLTASSAWTLVKGGNYTHKLVSRTTAEGATLTGSFHGNTLGVVVTTCATCGRLGVYSNGTLVETIDLLTSATHYRHVTTVSLGTNPVQTKVTLRVLSSGRTVEVDGLGAVTR